MHVPLKEELDISIVYGSIPKRRMGLRRGGGGRALKRSKTNALATLFSRSYMNRTETGKDGRKSKSMTRGRRRDKERKGKRGGKRKMLQNKKRRERVRKKKRECKSTENKAAMYLGGLTYSTIISWPSI